MSKFFSKLIILDFNFTTNLEFETLNPNVKPIALLRLNTKIWKSQQCVIIEILPISVK